MKKPYRIISLLIAIVVLNACATHKAQYKNEEDKMAWLSKFCDKNISQSSLTEKFKIGDFFDENWAKDIDVTCLNKLS